MKDRNFLMTIIHKSKGGSGTYKKELKVGNSVIEESSVNFNYVMEGIINTLVDHLSLNELDFSATNISRIDLIEYFEISNNDRKVGWSKSWTGSQLSELLDGTAAQISELLGEEVVSEKKNYSSIW